MIEWDISLAEVLFGVLEEGLLYVALLILATILCAKRALQWDSFYWIIPIFMWVNLGLFRMSDAYFDSAGVLQGGLIGRAIVESALASDLNPVPYIAGLMMLVDLLSAYAILHFTRYLLLSRVVAVFFAAIIGFCYMPAAAGLISGDTAILWANIIGCLQLLVICADAGGPNPRVDRVADAIRNRVWSSDVVERGADPLAHAEQHPRGPLGAQDR